MKEAIKTKVGLLQELETLRQEAALLREADAAGKRTESALMRATALLTSTIEFSADGILVIDNHGVVTIYNKKFLSMWGIPESLASQRDDGRLLDYVLHQLRDPEAFLEKVRYLYAHPGEESFDVLELANGRIFERFSLPQRTGGRVSGRVWSFRDVTDRRNAQQEERRQRETAERLAQELAVIAEIGRIIGSTLNLDEVYERFAAEVCRLIACDRLVVSLHDLRKGTMRIAYVWGTAVAGRRCGDSFPLSGTNNETLIRTRAGFFIHPQGPEEIADRYPTLTTSYAAGMRSMMSIPLIARGEVIGVLAFRSKTPQAFTEQDLRLAERIGEQIAGAIASAELFAELKRTEQSLRESEARFRAIFDQAAVGVAEVDISTRRFLMVNRRLCETLGMTEKEMLATTFASITYPEDVHLHEDKMADLVAGKIDSYTIEKRYLRKDGGIIWVNATVAPLWKPGETPERDIVVVEDITERKRTDEVLYRNRETTARLAREMGVIAEIGRIIGSTLNIDEVYERFVAAVQKLIPADRLGITLHSLADGVVKIAYVTGKDVPGRQKGDCFPLTGTLNEMLIRTRTGILVHPESLEELQRTYPTFVNNYKAGVRSIMSIPLISRDEVIGVLDFRSMQPNAYTLEDLNLAHRIAEQISGAISGAQLFADLKKVEKSLRESEARFRPLFEQASVGVAEVDIRTGRYLTVNRRQCEILGMTEEEMQSMTFHDVSHPDDRNLHVDKMADLLAGKIKNYTLEKRYLRKDGEVIWVNITVAPLWKPGETPDRNIVVIEDVTERKRMQEEIERRSKQLTVLHETSLELSAELNLSTLLHSITENALNLIGGVSCRCYLHRPGADLLERVASAGRAKLIKKTTWKRNEGVVGRVWATGAPLLINDYRGWSGRIKSGDSLPSRAVLGVPIRYGEEFLGVLNIAAELPHRYSQTDIEVLGMFAMQAAIAIRNARLYTRIEQLAVTDELTALLNRRGFFQLGEREFERALRFKRPLAAVMFDIDHFKEVNDTYGHQAGDQVLRALADCVRQKTRGIDVAGRYGGEEFVLLMPETPMAETAQIAERLRHSIMKLSIPVTRPGDESSPDCLRITVSIGVAMQEEGVLNLVTLVDRADQAQYRAKRAGRNRVVVWEKQEEAHRE